MAATFAEAGEFDIVKEILDEEDVNCKKNNSDFRKYA